MFICKSIKAKSVIKYLLLIALFVGLGLLSKYALLFFYPISFLYLLLYHREKLKQSGYYFCVILSLLFFLPFVFLNLKYQWFGLGYLAQLSGFFQSSHVFIF